MIYSTLVNIYSYEFFAFLAMYTLIYYLLPRKIKILYLIFLSLLFYSAANPILLIVPVYVIIISYLSAFLLAAKQKKTFLFVTIGLILLPLLFFKYFNFFSFNSAGLARLVGWNYDPVLLELALPIGISFFAFKALSYVIDVYRRTIPAEKRPDFVALYILFFPSIIAGPIDRAKPLFGQFSAIDDVDPKLVKTGIMLFIWGLFQKVIVADKLSIAVNTVFDHPQNYGSFHFIMAAVFFAVQIYCDFSGYTDMAIGAGMLFGIRLMKNFDKPYSAKSVAEFWRRWHISLSSWFRDYMFLPISYLLMRRRKKPLPFGEGLGWGRIADSTVYTLAVTIVMLTAGLWHGASWTFVLWGFVLAVFMSISIITRNLRRKFLKNTGLSKNRTFLNIWRTVFTFALITFSWIFFRSNTIGDSFYIIREIFTGYSSFFASLLNLGHVLSFKMTGLNPANLMLSIFGILVIMYYNFSRDDDALFRYISNSPAAVKYAVFAVFAFGVFLFGNFSAPQFIYFKF